MRILYTFILMVIPMIGISQEYKPLKSVSAKDSILIVNSMQGNWKFVKLYYMPVTSSNIKYTKTFIIDSNFAVIFNDTIKNIQYQCEQIISKTYLDWEYSLSSESFKKKYKITAQERDLLQPHITREFVVLDNYIYYDEDGVIYKFIKY